MRLNKHITEGPCCTYLVHNSNSKSILFLRFVALTTDRKTAAMQYIVMENVCKEQKMHSIENST